MPKRTTAFKFLDPDKPLGNVLSRIVTLLIVLAAAACFFYGTMWVFPTQMINIALFITACFLTLQAGSNIDRTHGFGAYSATTQNQVNMEVHDHEHHHGHGKEEPVEDDSED
jgi:K+-transporting ATPase A subunit